MRPLTWTVCVVVHLACLGLAAFGSAQNGLKVFISVDMEGITGVSGREDMMLPIDESFDAAIFIGYHAKAGTPDAILEHTSNGNVLDFSINGVSLPEGGYNALIAGLYDVPVVFVAGDTMKLQLKREETINDGALYPGATRTGDWEITYTSKDLLEVLKAFNATK